MSDLGSVRAAVRARLVERGALKRAGTALSCLAAPARLLIEDGAGGDRQAAELLVTHAAEALVAGRLIGRRGRSEPDELLDPMLAPIIDGVAGLERLLAPLDRLDAPDDVPSLFPGSFPARVAKRRGGHETRAALVDLVLDLAGWDGRGRLLEPTCGSGEFLLRAWRRALEAGHDPGSLAERLVGVELHPFAARLLRLRLAWAAGAGPAPRVVEADVLGEGLPGQLGRFDLIVGNPPWVRGERIPTDRRAALRARWPALGQGNVDLAAYVVARSLELLAPGGRLALVLPQGLLDARAAAGLRELLASRTIEAVLGLEWVPPCFDDAAVIPCILVVRDGPPPAGHRVRLAAPARLDAIRWSRVDQADWLELGRGRCKVEVRKGDLSFLRTLASAPTPVRAGYGLAIRTATSARALVGDARAARRFADPRPLIDGREVRPFSIDWAGRFIDGGAEAISDPKSATFFTAPKVVAPRIALTTQAAVDDGRTAGAALWCRNTVMVLRAPGTPLDDRPHALAALVNSTAVRVHAHLLLRAAALAGSHRATFYVEAWNATPVPAALLEDAKALAALDRLGREAARAAAAGDARGLARVTARIDERVAALFGLAARARRWLAARVAAAPLARCLRPVRAGAPTRTIAVVDHAAGARYA